MNIPASAVTATGRSEILRSLRNALEIEAEAIRDLAATAGRQMIDACELLRDCRGRVITSGMGKSGHIARKTAATFSSTGTPSMFMHPADAGHGDLGMLLDADIVLMFSNSGETAELISLVPAIKRRSIPILLMTGAGGSTLGRHAARVIEVKVRREACPLDLAPTASTIAMLAVADAIAITLLEMRGFTRDDFALAHPGGRLGRRLLLRICDIMHTDDKIPSVISGTAIGDAIVEMTRKRLGMVAITDESMNVRGIFTDGDLRRSLEQQHNLTSSVIDSVMTTNPVTIAPNVLAVEAATELQEHKVQALLVTENGRLIGALNIHDLLQHGVL